MSAIVYNLGAQLPHGKQAYVCQKYIYYINREMTVCKIIQ